MGREGEEHGAAMIRCLVSAAVLLMSFSTSRADETYGVKTELLAGSGRDGIFKADLKISNPNDFDVKDIKVHCIPFANSGTDLAPQNVTIYEIIPRKGTKTFRGFTVGVWPAQAKTAGCTTRAAQKR